MSPFTFVPSAVVNMSGVLSDLVETCGDGVGTEGMVLRVDCCHFLFKLNELSVFVSLPASKRIGFLDTLLLHDKFLLLKLCDYLDIKPLLHVIAFNISKSLNDMDLNQLRSVIDASF